MEQLLKILENNARLPVEDIATMLNKSPAEVAAMMDLARAQGIIKGCILLFFTKSVFKIC